MDQEKNTEQKTDNNMEAASADQNAPNTPPQDTAPQPTPESSGEGESSAGPIIGSVIIIIIIIIGGLYFWGQRLTREARSDISGEEIRAEEDTVTASLEVQSSSDEIADIEADLNLTDLENLDADLDSIDLEL